MKLIHTYLRATRSFFGRYIRDFQRQLYAAVWFDKNVTISWLATVDLDANAELTIGSNSSIGPYTVLSLVGDPLLNKDYHSILRIG